MDLDAIKGKWKDLQNLSPSQQGFGPSLKYPKGIGALGKLKRMDLIFILIPLVLVAFPFLLNRIAGEELGFDTLLSVLYIALCFWSAVCNTVKYFRLKKIDIASGSLLQNAKHILVYKKYVMIEKIFGLAAGFIIMSLYCLHVLKIITTDTEKMLYILYVAFITALMLVGVWIFYKKTYLKYIAQVREAMQDLEEE
jgi:predicted small secreted protein